MSRENCGHPYMVYEYHLTVTGIKTMLSVRMSDVRPSDETTCVRSFSVRNPWMGVRMWNLSLLVAIPFLQERTFCVDPSVGLHAGDRPSCRQYSGALSPLRSFVLDVALRC
eukprot:5125091-Pyramimonas_sp.AAC.1